MRNSVRRSKAIAMVKFDRSLLVAALFAFSCVLVSSTSVRGDDARSDAQGAGSVDPAMSAKRSHEAAMGWLLKNQNADGSWGSHLNPLLGGFDEFFVNPETQRSWTVATTSLGCMAMFESVRTDETVKAFERGIDYVMKNALVKRSSEWDTDNVWAYVYSLPALVRAHSRPTEGLKNRRDEILGVIRGVLGKMSESQTPSGGWGYYDFEVYAHPGAWATSFTTAVGLLSLLDAKEAGIEVDAKMLDAAIKAVKRCRLPSGAYTYSVNAVPSPGGSEWIDQIKGSLSRIQVCNLALIRAGEKLTNEDLKSGLDQFFKEHKFLDVAYQRPIPHEAYYYNSGYFYFFGHQYASEVIARLPAEDQAKYWPLLQKEIIKRQEEDGSMWDFHMNSYGRPYGVAFSVMALARSLPGVDTPPVSDSKSKIEAGK